MALGLGVAVGSRNSVAAVEPHGAGATDGSDHSTFTRSSTLQLSAGESPLLGFDQRASAMGRHHTDVVVDDFLGRVGDPVGILADDGSLYMGEDLTATAIGCLVTEASAGLTDEPTTVATYPATWSHYSVNALREALERAGFGEVTPVPEATAAVAWLDAARGPLGDGAVLVYDLGASTLDIAVVRTGESSAILGVPLRSDDVSGAEFDHLTMQYVLENVGASATIDPFDPATENALVELRRRCATAKEALSAHTETTLRVDLPGVSREVRLVRGELEDLLYGPIATSVELVRETVRLAGLDVTDVSQVLLVGGGAAIPLVAEAISSQLGLPVVASATPDRTIAIGAAMLATRLSAASHALAEPVAAAAAAPVYAKAATPPRRAAAPTRAPAPAPLPAQASEVKGRTRKVAIVVAVVAAIMLLAAGGLSLRTGLGSDPKPATPPSQQVATPSPAAVTPSDPQSSDAEATQPGTETPGTQAAANPTARVNPQTTEANTPAPNNPAPNNPAPQPNAPQEPTAQQNSPAPIPAPQPAPAPQPSPAPQSPVYTNPNLFPQNSNPGLPLPKVPNALNPTGLLDNTLPGVTRAGE